MAGLVKPHCSIKATGEGLLWAVHVEGSAVSATHDKIFYCLLETADVCV